MLGSLESPSWCNIAALYCPLVSFRWFCVFVFLLFFFLFFFLLDSCRFPRLAEQQSDERRAEQKGHK